MSVKIGSARIDENGKAHGGKAGDQTGKEVSTQNWYAHKKGWVLLRATDAQQREKIALCMENACKNSHIGYDQYQRNSLYNAVQDMDFDVTRLSKDVETDCSALVRVCCAYAGITCPNFRTANQAKTLLATGAFISITDDAHCKKSDYLLRGDILVTKKQGHTVVVLTNGDKAGAAVRITGEEVNIRRGNGTRFAVISTRKKGDTLPFAAESPDGWLAVDMGDEVGWVSEKYAERHA